MDEFLNKNPETDSEGEGLEKEPISEEQQAEEPIANEEFEQSDPEPLPEYPEKEFTSAYNQVVYSPVTPEEDYKPMSRGLKVFAVVMAAVVLLTGSCLAGYFWGKNGSNKLGYSGSGVAIDLESRPKDTDEMTAAKVYEKVNQSIVGIVVYNASGTGSQASGIVFSEDGYIVTNDHIYADIASPKFKVYTHDGIEYDATYVAGDAISDLAVLKVDTDKLKVAKFGNSDELYYGQNVVAIGRPSDATDHSSITSGIISAVNRRVALTSNYSSRLIQTDSAINPGSSGGALVNMYGQVIGVTSSKLASTEYDNVGYAIPTDVMKRIVDELISEGKVVSRAKLGITYAAIDSVTAEIGGYDYVGIYIASVSEDSALYGKAKEGDIITHIDSTAITSDDIVLDIIEQSRAGDTITVTIVTSAGKIRTVDAVLTANISESSYTTEDKDYGNSSGNGPTFDFPYGE